ncbi:MAG: glycoside hydrolase family 2 TIM barrel-domain containing protein [Caldicoprobacterales bacterium]
MIYDLRGLWKADIGDGKLYPMQLPGTLDENKIGYRDTGKNQWNPGGSFNNTGSDFDEKAPVSTRLTRKYTFEGEARFTRHISFIPPEGKRVFLEAERARCLRLMVDGKEVPNFIEPSISTPHVFEVTGLLNGDNEITLISDNSYPGLPYKDIVFSSAATDETQTNWNGILGYLRLQVKEPVFISAVRIYPETDEKNTLTVKVEISADQVYEGVLSIESKALAAKAQVAVSGTRGFSEFVLGKLPLAEDVRRWDEYEGVLYNLTASLSLSRDSQGNNTKLQQVDSCTETFGVRIFGDNGKGRLALNNRTIFLRSETNCCVFPETGYAPMTVEEWIDVLETFKSYGMNFMRFHSYCPPKAAFIAADRLGMLMQPELSCWNYKNVFETDESYEYYKRELKQLILSLANHPSFVMLTFGNELSNKELGRKRMNKMLELARNLDNTRLYANGSNVDYGMSGCDLNSDFYTTQRYYKEDLRGTFAGGKENGYLEGYINNQYPSATANYDRAMNQIRKVYKKPVFSFEVGQYEVLPDFGELEEFKGITDPANIRLIKDRVEAAGISPEEWKRHVEATGEISRIGYREEIEAAMRTKDLSGISLLGLQDFPGQGTALVGMLNSHLKPKPYSFADPKKFKAFFTDQLPLVLLPKYTWENTESLTARIVIANYGKKKIVGRVEYELKGRDGKVHISGKIEEISCPVGILTDAGILEVSLRNISRPTRLDLTVKIDTIANTYPIWVYPPVQPKCPEMVYETECFDEKAIRVLDAGGIVYLTPPSTKEALPSSIKAQFTTDFWSVGTFPAQQGGMGQLIAHEHPIFRDFPTEFHTNWQWWPMATQRAVILPERYKAIITEMDSYAYLRPMAQLFECRCGNGRLLFSSLGLQNLQQYPEARALLNAIYRYLTSPDFKPEQVIEKEIIASLVKKC